MAQGQQKQPGQLRPKQATNAPDRNRELTRHRRKSGGTGPQGHPQRHRHVRRPRESCTSVALSDLRFRIALIFDHVPVVGRAGPMNDLGMPFHDALASYADVNRIARRQKQLVALREGRALCVEAESLRCVFTGIQASPTEPYQSIAPRSARSAGPDEHRPPSATRPSSNRCAAIDPDREMPCERSRE
jgi:hypothetical protein